MKIHILTLSCASALVLPATAAVAQPAHHAPAPGMNGAHGSHTMMAMDAFHASMMKMDKAMMAAKGPTTDVAFARKMLAHHQGAIDMARVELEHGSDADAKRIAQKTIDENTRGKAELEAWLRSHGG